ncbi:MAG TPA: hypothetical protein EYH59_07050 [Pyrodictium sp.]|nr:hypothetical protein [Pyrodictium sp.]
MQFVYTILALGWLLLLVHLMWIALAAKKRNTKRIWCLTWTAILILVATLLTITLEHVVRVN